MKKMFSYMLMMILGTSVLAQTKVIFDTDIGSDCDDAGAMAVLHKLADKGEVEILGVVYSSGKNKYGIGVCDAINTYYGRDALPLGQNLQDDVGDPRDFFSQKIATDTVTYRHDVISSAMDLVSAYKVMLEKEQDNSVTIITVGHPIGLIHSLRDDEATHLIRSKVSRWVAMGGGGWNFSKNGMAEHMSELLEKWPCKMYMSSYGEKVITGNVKLPQTAKNNPVRKAYESFIWNCLEKGRPSWDQIALLFAARPQYFRVESHGSVQQMEDKSVHWNSKIDNPKHFNVLPKISDIEMRDIIEDLMSELPNSSQQVNDPDPKRFAKSIIAFAEQDKKSGFDKGSIVFVGSSSVRMLNIPKYFPGLRALNRGFGGAHISDVNYYIEQTVLKYEPSKIVFFCGGNDLWSGKSVQQVKEDFENFTTSLFDRFPNAELIVLGTRPSPRRIKILETELSMNAVYDEIARNDKRIEYLGGSCDRFLDADGQPIIGLYAKDKVHMNDAGYRIWVEILEPWLR